MTNGASLAMAIATGVSLLCSALVFFIVPANHLKRGTP
jgi:hypothetical protein